jgi:hypothetical protein
VQAADESGQSTPPTSNGLVGTCKYPCFAVYFACASQNLEIAARPLSCAALQHRRTCQRGPWCTDLPAVAWHGRSSAEIACRSQPPIDLKGVLPSVCSATRYQPWRVTGKLAIAPGAEPVIASRRRGSVSARRRRSNQSPDHDAVAACRQNSVHCHQAVIRGTWSGTRPSTARVQVRRATRRFPTVGRSDHRQLAKRSIPTGEPIGAVRSLRNFLQNRRRKPDWIPSFERVG